MSLTTGDATSRGNFDENLVDIHPVNQEALEALQSQMPKAVSSPEAALRQPCLNEASCTPGAIHRCTAM